MKSLCIFGDSTAWGAWDNEKGGWVNRLWFFVSDLEDYCEVYNLSISGGTSETILERFENEANIREADGLIFQTGGNDSAWLEEVGNHFVSPEKFADNILEIIKRAKKITKNILFVGFEKCDETKTKPVSWAKVYYTNENIKQYNEIMQRVCHQENILFLNLFDDLNVNDLEDGLHPNTEGHIKIFEKIKNFLIKEKWL